VRRPRAGGDRRSAGTDGGGSGWTHRGGDGRTWGRSDLDPKTPVLGIARGGEAVGFPAPRVRDAGGVLTHEVGGEPVVVFATDSLQAYRNPGYVFEPVDTGFRADGAVWEPATESTDGRVLSPVPARRLFAFAWQDDHGPDAFYGRG